MFNRRFLKMNPIVFYPLYPPPLGWLDTKSILLIIIEEWPVTYPPRLMTPLEEPLNGPRDLWPARLHPFNERHMPLPRLMTPISGPLNGPRDSPPNARL